MNSIGIDAGSTAVKLAIYDGKEFDLRIRPTGWSPKETVSKMLEDIENEKYIVTTGYGRMSIANYDKRVTEITCHGKGANYLREQTRTIIDIGGQDSKIIRVNNKGQVIDFLMNDKCAAGTGKFLEMTCHLLEKDIRDLDEFVNSTNPANINAMCAVFAESEIISLLASGERLEDIAAGVIDSIVKRTLSLIGRVGFDEDIFFSGGLSRSKVIRKCFENTLKKKIHTHKHSQFTGAIGAALIGYEVMLKED